MSEYHRSGTRRDVCAVLYEVGELRGQQLKSALSSHYDRRIDPKQFYGMLDALVDSGHVEKREEGLHDVYALTDAGERALLAHVEWLRSLVESD